MSKLYKNRSIIMIACMAIIIVVIIAVTSVDRNQISGAESLIGSILKPVTKFVTVIVNFVRNSVTGIAEIGGLRDTNELLNQQVISLRAQVRELEALRQENQRLREMLDFKNSHSEFDLIGCSIIGKDPNNIFSTFIIDKGRNDGIGKNMPVLTNAGLVGQVMEVGENWAKVIPLSDPRSSVSIIVNRTRDAAILKGNMESRLNGQISPEAPVVEGDEVVTSGMGEVYPKGLLVGKIVQVKTDENQLLRYITVEPVIDFEKLEEVFVLKYSKSLPAEGEISN
ncbi:MAG: Rod shape-determining protein MreC [Firmicutes bacterium]|nr:Rod shape-determining protein MreC [Bacillota bacterium]MDI6706520.1 rod shape-determining protein MreC [Bacillota bacterium]